MFSVDRLDQSAGLQVVFFPLVGWSAVVLMLGLMDLFATAFISFTSKNWQAVKWNFGLDFQLDCLETFVKIFCFCAATASSSYDCFKGKKSYLLSWFVWVKVIFLRIAVPGLFYPNNIFVMKCVLRNNMHDLNNHIREEIILTDHTKTVFHLSGFIKVKLC